MKFAGNKIKTRLIKYYNKLNYNFYIFKFKNIKIIKL